jgi:hypothetical protein
MMPLRLLLVLLLLHGRGCLVSTATPLLLPLLSPPPVPVQRCTGRTPQLYRLSASAHSVQSHYNTNPMLPKP